MLIVTNLRILESIAKNVVLCAVLLLFAAGCTGVKAYRTGVEPAVYDKFNHGRTDLTNVIEVATNYTLGFVEFDDQGWLYDRDKSGDQWQISEVTKRISDELKANSLLIVVFVHGWKHNADGADENVATFHDILQKLGDIELDKQKEGPARRVFGVYVGWRGLSETIEPFKELSFFGRKNTAEKVGHGAVVQLLAAIEDLRDQYNRENASAINNTNRAPTKLIAVGHSFGADVLYCAIAPILAERMVENRDDKGNPSPPKSLGDLAVLVNPAFEAARLQTLQKLGNGKEYPGGTNCTLAIFTSVGDSATGFWFPLGRRVSTLFERYKDRGLQRKANITAVGHYEPFINYELKTMRKEPKQTKQQSAINENPEEMLGNIRRLKQQKGKPDADLTYDFPNANCRLSPVKDHYKRGDPILNVKVSKAIIKNHDDFANPHFREFMVEFFAVFSHEGL